MKFGRFKLLKYVHESLKQKTNAFRQHPYSVDFISTVQLKKLIETYFELIR